MATKKKKTTTNGKAKARPEPAQAEVEWVRADTLKPHPRNYQTHPDDQLAHIAESLASHGFYRNIVVAREGTILAGHGVVLAAIKTGREQVPVMRLDLSPDEPRALKVLTSDNEIGNLAEVDDRALTELLKGIMNDDDVGLLGTGFDEKQLAALAMVTRPAAEILDNDEAAQWVGMPDHEPGTKALYATVSFLTAKARESFLKKLGIKPESVRNYGAGGHMSMWWPPRKRNDMKSLRFEQAKK
jgi:hypothetical protein